MRNDRPRKKLNFKRAKSMCKREQGWNQYVMPISAFNEKVHSSMKIDFGRI